MLLASPLVCIAGGSVIGAGVFTLVNVWQFGSSEGDFGHAYLGFLLYSLVVTVPVGGASGVIAALLILALGNGSYRRASLPRWIGTGGVLGAAGGFGCPVILAGFGFVDDGSAYIWFLTYGITGGLAGGVVGVGLGWLAWWEFSASDAESPIRGSQEAAQQ